jgi:hypothetical protein
MILEDENRDSIRRDDQVQVMNCMNCELDGMLSCVIETVNLHFQR